MLTVGDRFPEFELTGVVSLEKGQEFEQVSNQSYRRASGRSSSSGRWTSRSSARPRSPSSARRNADFKDRDAQVLGA